MTSDDRDDRAIPADTTDPRVGTTFVHEGWTITVDTHPDPDSTPTGEDWATPAQVAAWNADEWTYVGCRVTASKDGIELGTASLWGIESGRFTYTDEDDRVIGEGYVGPYAEAVEDLIGEAIADGTATLARLCAGTTAGASLIEIHPASPAWQAIARGIDAGRKVSIEPRADGVAVKIGEDMWTLALATTGNAHQEAAAHDHYRLREIIRVIDRDIHYAHKLQAFGPGGERTKTLSLTADEMIALAAMLDRADNRA